MTIDEMQNRLSPMNKREVARQCGLSYGAVRNFMKPNASPKYATVEKIRKFLEAWK